MKQKSILLVVIIISFFSCEDVIDIDVPNSEPRLVIDASINWLKGTPGNQQIIKLTLTTPYFNTTIPPANNAQVTVRDQDNNVFKFIEDGNTGVYYNNDFIPEINGIYTLNIDYKDEIYTGTESLLSVPEFDFIEQDLEGGFTGEDTEIKAYFTDPKNEDNYYFFEFIPSTGVRPTSDIYNDEFVNGNQVFGLYIEESLHPGDHVLIKNYGVSRRFYEFMYILLQQKGGAGGPFGTQPATVRGNCINTTNSNNYPLGYFRLSEMSEVNYEIQP